MSGVRKTFAALLLAWLTLVSAAPIACAGWEPSASDRMACCKRAAHGHAVDQAMADSCCAGHEQSRQSEATVTSVVAVTSLAPSAVLPAFDLSPADLHTGNHLPPSVASGVRHPPGLLAPPLRI